MIQRVLSHSIGLLMLAMLWSACGASTVTLTPDQVHRQWVMAMQENDRTKAAAVLASTQMQNLDGALNSMQIEQNSPVLGPLLGQVDIQAPSAVGAGMTGRSIWRFTNKTECYTTTLAQVDSLWRVTNWSRVNCQ